MSHDYLTSDDVVLEELSLAVIDTGTKIEALKAFRTEEKMTDKEYIRRLSEAFGFDEERYNNFARVNINTDIKGTGEEDRDHRTSVISRLGSGEEDRDHKISVISRLGTGEEDRDHKSSVISRLGTDEDDRDHKTSVISRLDTGEEDRDDKTSVISRLGTGEEDRDHETSVISRLDLSMLDNMTVKDLPEKIRLKLLSMLRLQRKRKRRQMRALANKKTVGQDAEVDEGDNDQGTDDEDQTGNGDLSNNRRNSTVKRNRKKRDSQGRPGKVHGSGGSMEDISDQETGKFYLSVATR